MTNEWLKQVALSALADLETCEATYDLCRDVLRRDVPGDFVECGVYAGAQPAIMAQALLDHNLSLSGDQFEPEHRRVHLFDTFAGIPAADPVDEEIWAHHGARPGESAYSLERVRFNMEQWRLPSEIFVYHAGLFEETIPKSLAPTVVDSFYDRGIALLRLDGDLYSSTKVCLELLFPMVKRGGWVCVDDFNLSGCRKAVLEYIVPAPIYWRVPTK